MLRKYLVVIASAWFALGVHGLHAEVWTYHNDNARSGLNPDEIVLTPTSVNADSFGRLFTLPVDGNVDAQPLCVSSVPIFINGVFKGRHNLVIVATENASVYGFDADSGTQYWKTSLLGDTEIPSDNRNCGQVSPQIGITATPVIGRGKGPYGAVFVVSMSKNATVNPAVYHQRLHALDLSNGTDLPGSPVEISANYPGSGPNNDGKGHVIFDPAQYKERPGLLMVNGNIYTSWSSHCDHPPYTSWIIAYGEQTLAQTAVLNLDPNGTPATGSFLPDGSGSSFWNSGAGPAADSEGNIYELSANGPFDTNLNFGFPRSGDYGDSFIKLTTQRGLQVLDYFSPFDQNSDANTDADLGSGGIVLLPDMVDVNRRVRHLAVAAGKDQNIYVVDRDRPGKINLSSADNRNLYQEIHTAFQHGVFGTAAYFNGAIYYGAVNSTLRRYTFSNARLNTTPASETALMYAYPGTTPSISSFGDTNGIVWTYENTTTSGTPAVIHAYDALDLSREFYNSAQNATRDQFGVCNKFITPTISNGKVYAGSTDSVGVFGLLRPAAATDETKNVSLERGSLQRINGNGHLTQTVILKNVGTAAIVAPISLVFDSLGNSSSLTNASGGTAITVPSGSPYTNVPLMSDLAPGQTVSVQLDWVDSRNGLIAYTPRILAGSNGR